MVMKIVNGDKSISDGLISGITRKKLNSHDMFLSYAHNSVVILSIATENHDSNPS